MKWVQRKIYLYNVTFGLYMLDWWERYLFNTLVVVLMWFIFYNTSRYMADNCKSLCRDPLDPNSKKLCSHDVGKGRGSIL